MKGATMDAITPCMITLISIHAPMKGATLHIHIQLSCYLNFNPRTHEGCDSLQINSVIACFSIIYIAN